MASRPKRWAAVAAVIGVVAMAATAWVGYGRFRPETSAASVRVVTFNRHVAPIVFQNCAGCHRPGEAAPFSLLSYQDVRKHATQIAEVTRSRQMPPWQPDAADPACGPFENERRLTDDQITLINRWAAEGQVEGDPSDLPAAPPPAGGRPRRPGDGSSARRTSSPACRRRTRCRPTAPQGRTFTGTSSSRS